jgi:aspartate ammonia-lyase
VVKSGRTHLQDAAPMILGQEFGGYARAIERSIRALGEASEHLRELGIGGSAVGTGLTAHAGYRQRVVDLLAEYLDTELVPSVDKFEAMQSNQPFALVSGAMRSAALELTRIANDLRLLSSGPRTGLGDIRLPPVQPGSSIMPGKVNPVMAEVMNMVAFQVVGFDTTIAMAVQAGQMELNVMMPVINYNLLQGMIILGNCVRLLTDKCVRGIEANEPACRDHLLSSVGLATILKPIIGYAASSEIAKESVRTGRPIGQLAVEGGLLSREQFEKLVAPEAMDIDRAHPKDTEAS